MGNIEGDYIPRNTRLAQEYDENQFLARIKAIPPLSEEEAVYLLTKWRDFKDTGARRIVMKRSLHLVLPIAKATTRRFGFMGNRFMTVYFDMIGAGSIGLCQAVDAFRPDRGSPWTNYARRCISRECIHAAKSMLSVVKVPYYAHASYDLMLDPSLPDVVSAEDYCGSRARVSTGSDRQEAPIGTVHANMRPWPKDWEVRFRRADETLGAKIYDLRKAGLTLKEVAERLGMSTTTVWRRQQAHLEGLYG